MAKLTSTEVSSIAFVITKTINAQLDAKQERELKDPTIKNRAKELLIVLDEIPQLDRLIKLRNEMDQAEETFKKQVQIYRDQHEGSPLYTTPSENDIKKEKERVVTKALRKEGMLTFKDERVDDWQLTHLIRTENTKCEVATCDLHDVFMAKMKERFGLK